MNAMQITHGDAANIRFTLEENQIASTSEARGLALECVKGSVWITIEGSRADYVLKPGERLPIVSRGRLVVQGLIPSEVKFVVPPKLVETANKNINAPDIAQRRSSRRVFANDGYMPFRRALEYRQSDLTGIEHGPETGARVGRYLFGQLLQDQVST